MNMVKIHFYMYQLYTADIVILSYKQQINQTHETGKIHEVMHRHVAVSLKDIGLILT